MSKSLRERLKEQAENLKKRGPGKFLSPKEGTTRFRVLPVGKEKDWAFEATYFYLGLKDNMAIISPASFGKKCAIMKAYTTMSESKSAADRERAKKFKPGKRFFVAVVKYKDDKGKEIDTEVGIKLMILTGGMYQEMIELYLDDNDNGDFTDPKEGYDLKIKRVGKGKMDTEYSLFTGKRGIKLPPEYRKPVDLIAMVREITPTYEETKVIIEQYLNLPPEEGDDDEAPKKKKKKKRDI